MVKLLYSRGTASEIETSISGQTITFTLADAVVITTSMEIAGGILTFGEAQNASIIVDGVAGMNIPGKSLTIASGASTGGVTGGNIVFQISPAGGAGNTPNTIATVLTLAAQSITLAKDTTFSSDAIFAGYQMQDTGFKATETIAQGAWATVIGENANGDSNAKMVMGAHGGAISADANNNIYLMSNKQILTGLFDMASFTAGDKLFLDDGTLTTTEPSAGLIIRAGWCVNVANDVFLLDVELEGQN